MKNFKRIMNIVFALIMVLSMAACGDKNPVPTEVANPIVTNPVETEPTVTDAIETSPTINIENPVTFFSMSIGESYDDIRSINVFANEDGTIYVEYVGDEKKVGDLGAEIMNGILAELSKTELASLNGQDAYGDGDANGSMHIEFADGTMLSVNYTGEIPEAFTNGYDIMDVYFKTLTADMEVYIPQPMVMGEVNEDILAEILAILNGSNMPNLDSIAIDAINPTDEFFGGLAGLTSNDCVANAASAAPMMMSQAYSLVVVELEDANMAENVAKDFDNNIDWRKWVCVAPDHALTAIKDNMVLCLQAAGDAYTMTSAGIEAAGWIRVNELTNPDM